MTYQIANALLAYTLDIIQRTCDKVLATLLAVECDAEAVCLITNMTYDLQRLACATEVVGRRVARIEYLFYALCKTYDRYSVCYAEFA